MNDNGAFDVTTLDFHVEVLDELDQEPVPLFFEKLSSQIRQLLLCRYMFFSAHLVAIRSKTNAFCRSTVIEGISDNLFL